MGLYFLILAFFLVWVVCFVSIVRSFVKVLTLGSVS